MRWLVTLGILAGLLAAAWNESIRLRVWLIGREAERAYYQADFEGAVALYERARDLLPGVPESHTDLADTISQGLDGTPGEEMDLDRLERMAGQAVRDYLHSISGKPADAWSYAGLASLIGTVRAARAERAAMDLSLLSPNPIENLRPEDRFFEAAMVKAVQLEPRNYYYRDFLGDFYLRRGFESRAVEHFRAAARLHPVLDRHYYIGYLATVYPSVLTAVEQGIDAVLSSGHTEVSVYEVHRSLADLYLRMGRLDEAKARLELAAEAAPLPNVVDDQLGLILARQGDDAGALDAFRRSVERDPSYYRAWVHLALTYSRLGRHDEAIESAQRARGLAPAEFATTRALADALERAGNLDEATGLLESLIRSHPTRQNTYSRLIAIYEKTGKLWQAVRVARELAAKYPDEPAFAEQLEQLEQSAAERR